MRAALVVVGLFLLVAATPPSASATLVETDLFAPGDGLLTLDTATGLEWLDVTETIAQSYDSVVAGYGGFTTTHGFSTVTQSQVTTLLMNAGVLYLDNIFYTDSGHAAAIAQVVGLLGVTQPQPGSWDSLSGYVDYDVISPTQVQTAWIRDTTGQVNNIGGAIGYYGPFSKSVPVNSTTGTFLVRAAVVPEPSTALLLGLGLCGLGLRRVRAA